MSEKENESPVALRRRGLANRGLKSSANAGNALAGRSALPAKLAVCDSPSDVTEEWSAADLLQDEPPADSDEDEETDMIHMPDLLQASTAAARRPTTAKSRMSLGGSLLRPAARVNAEGRAIGVARAANTSSPRKRVRARPSPRGKKLQANPDPLPVVAGDDPSPPTTRVADSNELMKVFAERSHSRPEVSLQKVDLLSLIEKIPNIADEYDRMQTDSLDRKEVIIARMIESGKLESLINVFREQRSVMVAELTEKQQLVFNQWQKIGELELQAASSEALGAQNRCLEREITGLQNAQTQLETENASLKDSLNDANQELASTVRQSTMTSQTHQQKLKSLQTTIDTLKIDLEQAHQEAADEAGSAAAELKKVKANYEKQLEDLQAAKDEGVALADDLTKTMESRLEESAAEIDSIKSELAAAKEEFESKLAASKREVKQAEATISDLEAQLAEKETEVAEATQHTEATKANLEKKLAASEKKFSSTNEAVRAVKEQLSHEQEARAAAEASLKTQTDVTMPAMKKTVEELKQQVADLKSTAAADMKSSQDASEAAEQEIADLKKRLHDTTDAASALRKEINNSQEDNKSMGEELTELKEKLETATSTSDELKARLAGMEAKTVAADGEKDRLANELEEANTMQQRFAQQVEVLAKQMKETASDLEQLRGEKEAETAKAAAMAEQFEPLRQEVNTLQNEKRELADEKERMEIRIKLLEENSSDEGRAQLSLATDNEFAKKQHGSLLEELEQLRLKVGEQADQLMKQTAQIIDGEAQRKKMHNTICELKGNIRVFCRVRPMMDHDGDSTVGALRFPKNTVDDKEAIEVVGVEGIKTQFGFDKVFPERSSQLQIFNEVSSLVQSAIDGYRCCIFAYGQTGTGKTHTMQGASGEERGIIPRSLEMIVAETQRLKLQGWKYTLHASFLEIHNENLRDLLADPTAPKASLSIQRRLTHRSIRLLVDCSKLCISHSPRVSEFAMRRYERRQDGSDKCCRRRNRSQCRRHRQSDAASTIAAFSRLYGHERNLVALPRGLSAAP